MLDTMPLLFTLPSWFNETLQGVTMFLSVLLVMAVILQVKGTGTGFFGSAYGTFRTRRGFEQILFRATIFLVFMFVVVAVVSARWG